MVFSKNFDDMYWAGTEQSLHAVLACWDQIVSGAPPQAGPGVPLFSQQEEELPRLLSIQDGVGVISIKGPLVNSDSPYLRYFGVVGYPEIRQAVIAAAEHADIKSIVLDIASGGGAVNGVADTANLISMVDKQLKPVYAFTDGAMASAAYWLGASARKVSASQTAMLGSIGVIATVLNYSKAMANEGVGVNVVRSGKYKALINSVEEPTKEALAQLQAQLDTLYGIFIGHVASSRGVSVAAADEKMGQGREFLGTDAVKAGLADAVETFDALMSRISAKLLDNQGMTNSNSGTHKDFSMKTALTEQDIAALAAGAAPAAETKPAEGAPVVETPPVEGEPQADVQPPKVEAEVTQPAAGNDVVAFIRGELRDTQTSLAQAQVELKAANEKLAALETTHGALVKIAAASFNNMRVALSLPAVDMTKASAEALLADHAATAESFAKAFKAGGVAAVTTAEVKEPVAVAQPSALEAARRQATGIK